MRWLDQNQFKKLYAQRYEEIGKKQMFEHIMLKKWRIDIKGEKVRWNIIICGVENADISDKWIQVLGYENSLTILYVTMDK